MIDWSFISGTDESYEIPNKFSEAWYHSDSKLEII